MTNEELNTALYEKMFAEQETYRAWLLSQPPEEILNHAYEYTVREDILMSLEYHDLPDAQAKALLKSPSPLADVFADWENKETGHMDDIWQTVGERAKAVPFPVSWTVKMKKKQKETQDILSYHTQAAGCSDKARAKASGGRQPIEECGRTGL